MNFMKVALLIFRWFEHRGEIDDARKAVEADLIRIGKFFKHRADNARDAVDLSSDSVLLDPDNRDTKATGDDK